MIGAAEELEDLRRVARELEVDCGYGATALSGAEIALAVVALFPQRARDGSHWTLALDPVTKQWVWLYGPDGEKPLKFGRHSLARAVTELRRRLIAPGHVGENPKGAR